MTHHSPPTNIPQGALLQTSPVSQNTLEEMRLPRRGIAVTIDRWASHQVAAYLSSFGIEEFDRNGRPPGFKILSRRILSRQFRSLPYPAPSELPVEQQQPFGQCGSFEFDRALVALVGPCLVGIVYCEWLRFKREETFWGYNLSFVDVHESWRGNRISSALIAKLNNEPWLKGRHLCLTSYTELGQERIAHVISRELTSPDFSIKQPWY